MMIRSMGPEIIATDEIGSGEDIEAIQEASSMGIKLLLTTHGDSLWDIPKPFLKKKLFQYVVLLQREPHPGSVKKIWTLESENYVLCHKNDFNFDGISNF